RDFSPPRPGRSESLLVGDTDDCPFPVRPRRLGVCCRRRPGPDARSAETDPATTNPAAETAAKVTARATETGKGPPQVGHGGATSGCSEESVHLAGRRRP